MDPQLHALPEKHVEIEKKFARGRVLERMANLIMDGMNVEEAVMDGEIRFTAERHSYHPRLVKRMMSALNELKVMCADQAQLSLLKIIHDILTIEQDGQSDNFLS